MNNKGLTLFEIIITVAILGIVALLFMSIFSNGQMFIVDAGKDSKTLIDEQANIELAITSEAAGFEDKVDMFDLYPLLYGTPDVTLVEGVRIEEGTFTTFLPGVANYITPVTGLTLTDINGIDLTGDFIVIDVVGEMFNALASVLPIEATNQEIIWSTSDNGIAAVDDYGLVTATGVGNNVTISATTDEGGFSKSFSISVTGLALSSDSTLLLLQYFYPSDPTTLIDVIGFVPSDPPTEKNYIQVNIGPEIPVITTDTAVPTDVNAVVTNIQNATSLNSKTGRVATVEVTAEDGTKSYYRVEFKQGGS